jgi:tetratricopeptide (TPR) repeat protein
MKLYIFLFTVLLFPTPCFPNGYTPCSMFIDDGLLLADRGEHIKAIESFDEAIDCGLHKVDQAHTLFFRANSWIALNDLVKAKLDLDRSIFLYPYLPRVILQRGNLYLRDGGLEKACNSFVGALHFDPDYVAGHYSLALCFVEYQDFGLALASVSRALWLDACFFPAQDLRIALLLLLNRPDLSLLRAEFFVDLKDNGLCFGEEITDSFLP